VLADEDPGLPADGPRGGAAAVRVEPERGHAPAPLQKTSTRSSTVSSCSGIKLA
jgi:hypothetical protein